MLQMNQKILQSPVKFRDATGDVARRAQGGDFSSLGFFMQRGRAVRRIGGKSSRKEDVAAQRIFREILSGANDVLYVIPTTAETLSMVSDTGVSEKCCVIALEEYFCSSDVGRHQVFTPLDFMRILGGGSKINRRFVVFSDQFVSAEHAPLLVRRGEKELFFSTLEVVAVENYGFSIAIWSGDSFDFHAAPLLLSRREGVLRALSDYYEACDLLGGAWLARNRQHLRSPKGRVEEARERIRIYQSIVMISASDQAGLQLAMPLLNDLAVLRDRLPRKDAG